MKVLNFRSSCPFSFSKTILDFHAHIRIIDLLVFGPKHLLNCLARRIAANKTHDPSFLQTSILKDFKKPQSIHILIL